MLTQVKKLILIALRDVILIIVAADLLLGNLDQKPFLLLLDRLDLLARHHRDLIVQFLVRVHFLLDLLLFHGLLFPQPQIHSVLQFHDRHHLPFPQHSQVRDVLIQILRHFAVHKKSVPFFLSQSYLAVFRENGVRVFALDEICECHDLVHILLDFVGVSLSVFALFHEFVHTVDLA